MGAMSETPWCFNHEERSPGSSVVIQAVLKQMVFRTGFELFSDLMFALVRCVLLAQTDKAHHADGVAEMHPPRKHVASHLLRCRMFNIQEQPKHTHTHGHLRHKSCHHSLRHRKKIAWCHVFRNMDDCIRLVSLIFNFPPFLDWPNHFGT